MDFPSSLVARKTTKRHSQPLLPPKHMPLSFVAEHPKFQRSATGRYGRKIILLVIIIGASLLRNSIPFPRDVRSSSSSFPASFLAKHKVSPNSVWWSENNNNLTESLARVYEARSNHSAWCILEESNQPTHEWRLNAQNEAVGLIYIKTYKASSSTSEGINLSIAHNVGRRLDQDTKHDSTSNKKRALSPCVHYNRHVFQDIGGLQYREASRISSLVWTMVRYPIERDLSSFYFFEVSRKLNVTVTDELVIEKLRSYKGFQTSYLLPWHTNPWAAGSELLVKAAASNDHHKRNQVLDWMKTKILDEYDFIGVTERFDESLATMVLLWNLKTTDVIVLSAKQAGGYDDAGDTGRCSKILRPPKMHSPAVQEYLSNEHAVDNVDFLLWEAANVSLDRTIQHLGRERVQNVVDEIRNLQKLAEYWCGRQARFPCSSRGQKQLELSEKSCYVQDAGCGYACVDKIMAQYERREISFLSKDTILI